jgi:sialic acid synthase SpsE
MIRGIRVVEQALGSAVKAPSPLESGNRDVARRSVVAARPIRKGEAFTADSLAVKRPGHGISPMRFWEILGRRARRDFDADELIEL